MRSHWLKMGYWRWLWGRLPWEVRWVVLAALLLGLLGGGWVAASAATSNDGAEVAIGSNPIIIETTIEKVITVREHGKIIRKIVPVVKRVKVLQRAGTVYETRREYVTQVVRKPGHSVTRIVSEVVPVVTTEQITVNGKPRVVIKTQFQSTTRTKTVPLTQTLVATQNVTQTRPDGSAGHGHEDDDGAQTGPDADEDPDRQSDGDGDAHGHRHSDRDGHP